MKRYEKRVFWGDEMRYGTRTQYKRRWGPRGHRPRCEVKLGYEYGYLYCLLCPLTGELFCLFLPSMEKRCWERFVSEFEKWLGAQRGETLLVVDGTGSHQSDVLSAKSCLRLEKLPAASPELNPVERFFEALRRELSNRIYESLEEIEERLRELLEKYWREPKLVKSLTGYPYITTSFHS